MAAVSREDFTCPSEFRPVQFVRTHRGKTDLEHLGAALGKILEQFKAELVEVIHQDYDAFIRLSSELSGTDQTVSALRAHLAEREAELKELRASVSSKMHAIDEIAKQHAALRKRRRALLLQMELAAGLERCERALAADADALASGRELVQPADAERTLVARELERVADLLHRLATVAELEGLAEAGADVLDRLAMARRAASARALESTLWAVRSSNGAVLAHCMRAVDTLDAGDELVQHVRERIVRPRASQLARNTSGLPTAAALLAALEEYVRTHLGTLTPSTEAEQPGIRAGALSRALPPFRLVANAIWPELLAQLVAGRPGLFAPGQPSLFHANYLAAVRFAAAFEKLCMDGVEVAELRAHAASVDFWRRWNLPLYFQLRLNELSDQLEEELCCGAESAPAAGGEAAAEASAVAGAGGGAQHAAAPPALQLRASAATARALLACASGEIVLRPLAHRFLRLALQFAARYCQWAAASLTAAAPAAEAGAAAEGALAVGSCESAPAASSRQQQPQAVDVAAVGAALSTDATALAAWLRAEYAQLLVGALGLDEAGAEALAAGARECLSEAARQLDLLLPAVRAAVCAELEARCAQQLAGVRGIAAAYRFQAKEMPTQPSAFMRDVLQPLATFTRAHGGRMPTAQAQVVLEASLCAVAAHYSQLVSELARTTVRTETSIKRLQPRRQVGAAVEAGEAAGAPTDSDKIFAQLRIDAASFREQAAGLLSEERWPADLAEALHQVDLATTAQTRGAAAAEIMS